MKQIFTICCLFLIILLLTGCARYVTQPVIPTFQENLLTECTYNTPTPRNFVIDPVTKKRSITGEEALRLLAEWDVVYTNCAVSKDLLIKAIRYIQQQQQKWK